jgi:hypothetical protein
VRPLTCVPRREMGVEEKRSEWGGCKRWLRLGSFLPCTRVFRVVSGESWVRSVYFLFHFCAGGVVAERSRI